MLNDHCLSRSICSPFYFRLYLSLLSPYLIPKVHCQLSCSAVCQLCFTSCIPCLLSWDFDCWYTVKEKVGLGLSFEELKPWRTDRGEAACIEKGGTAVGGRSVVETKVRRISGRRLISIAKNCHQHCRKVKNGKRNQVLGRQRRVRLKVRLEDIEVSMGRIWLKRKCWLNKQERKGELVMEAWEGV